MRQWCQAQAAAGQGCGLAAASWPQNATAQAPPGAALRPYFCGRTKIPQPTALAAIPKNLWHLARRVLAARFGVGGVVAAKLSGPWRFAC